ncbi:hypothetical protein FH039_07355 [Thermococcus indicus]|uniref:Uncharacterized protein n=1 Tax=Thermococcus indicus TaxID=2586643 RepID=A0A4Y5SKL2_9EURY|nr:hypothetical protein [Thermococcus indicus]QDA31448.1 hypothetical protein FH039_07355 [Thermococcus indicus]
MKRKSTSVRMDAPKEHIVQILEDAPQFITNWPYVVGINTKGGINAEVLLPRFLFKFGDIYRFTIMSDESSYIYEGVGRKSHLIVTVSMREWQKNVVANVEIGYQGPGEFLLGKTLQHLVEGIAESLKKLAESGEHPAKQNVPAREINLDFSDPMSVASFLAKARMVHTGLHLVAPGELLNVIMDIRKNIPEDVLYVSGITQDGVKGFKLLLRRSQILAVEYRDGEGVKTLKVRDETAAREALELVSKVSGAYMVNVWVPVGGV